jgi:hypothetical protein
MYSFPQQIVIWVLAPFNTCQFPKLPGKEVVDVPAVIEKHYQ